MSVRLRLSEQEANVIYNLRENKDHSALKAECEAQGIPFESVGMYWHKSKQFSIRANTGKISMEEIRDELIKAINAKENVHQVINYEKYDEAHLLVLNPADIHVGKLGVESETGDAYNSTMVSKRVLDGVDGILQKTQNFNIDKILFVIGNDVLHTDNAFNTTTAGTRQDQDIMWFEAFKLAQSLYVDVINKLIQIAPIHIDFNPSNHDFTQGFMLAQVIEAWFKDNPNITFNVATSHRKYFNYFGNLIGTTHGDGAKVQDLPLLMAQEASEYWHGSKHRYVYTAHIHHKQSKDYGSVNVESFRSPSGTDSWHHRNGYTHAPKAIEAFLHSKVHGQIARISHIF